LLGEGGVGKTTIIRALVDGNRDTVYSCTQEVGYFPIRFNSNVGEFQLTLVDTVGQNDERSYLSNHSHYPGAHGAIVMYDLTSYPSYVETNKWKDNFLASFRDSAQPPVVFVGNKTDQKTALEEQGVRFEQLHEDEDDWKHFPVSARMLEHIMDPFLYLARLLMENQNLELLLLVDTYPLVDPEEDNIEFKIDDLPEIPGYDIDDLARFYQKL